MSSITGDSDYFTLSTPCSDDEIELCNLSPDNDYFYSEQLPTKAYQRCPNCGQFFENLLSLECGHLVCAICYRWLVDSLNKYHSFTRRRRIRMGISLSYSIMRAVNENDGRHRNPLADESATSSTYGCPICGVALKSNNQITICGGLREMNNGESQNAYENTAFSDENDGFTTSEQQPMGITSNCSMCTSLCCASSKVKKTAQQIIEDVRLCGQL
ncbi:hypothetical protein AB6A40_009810 [Gnathostoma spinigerum]|uniref:RING-type domain-containing protein n=1 Tax=Gnathostoma spinigerum TaxID=75299 RepID=A0ABD6EUT3_9BILA